MATDESGLLYMRSRYYSPALHQFLSADSYMGDLYHPLSLNPYSYVEGNPVRYIDPMGYWATPFGDYQAHYRQPQDPQQYLQIPDNQIHYETKHTFHSLKHTPQNRRILRRQFHQSLYDTYPVCEQIRTNSRDFTHGLVASADNNLAFGAGQWIAAGKTRPNLLLKPDTTAYYAGKTTGDAFFTVYGVIEIASGISISGTGAIMSSTGVGAVAGAPMAIEGVALAGHGTLVASVSLVNMKNDFQDISKAGKDHSSLDIDDWHEGSFDTAEESLLKHFEKHGEEVGARTPDEYLRKAREFRKNLKRARTVNISGQTENVTRYYKNGKYIDLASDKRIISFGKQ